MGRLAGRVALISGSARGQGAAEAQLFAEEGAFVVVSDVLDAEGAAVAAGMGSAGAYVHLDVTSESDWIAAVARAEERYGHLDILVNNAGIGIPPHGLLTTTPEQHRRTLAVNLDGVWLGMRAAAPAMARAGGGSIVNISSIDGLTGIAGMASYAATKWAVTGLTRTAAIEWGPHGIRVNSVHPGVIETPMVRQAPPEIRQRLDALVRRQPVARMGTPLDVAYMVLFLACDESSYVTGAQFVVDGGHLAGPWRDLEALGAPGL